VTWENYEVREFTVTSEAGLAPVIELPAAQKTVTFLDDSGNSYTAREGKLTLPAGRLHLTAEE